MIGREEHERSLPAEEIEAALSGLVADSNFLASPRNRKFLEYIVREQLAGRGDRIKAYSIATEIFGRSVDFDPIQDPIVRIEARRLRAALDQFYDDPSHICTVRISIPKGGYSPSFEPVVPQPKRWAIVGPTPIRNPNRFRLPSFLGIRLPRRVSDIALGICLGVVAVLVVLQNERPPGDPALLMARKPVLLVELAETGGPPFSLAFRDQLLGSLAKFERWQVRDIVPGAALTVASVSSAPGGPYKLYLRQDQTRLWWKLTDQSTGEVLGSDVIPSKTVSGGFSEDTNFINDLADRLGGSKGLVTTSEIRRNVGSEALGFGCIAKMEAEIWARDRSEGLPAIKTCLEESLSLQPNDADLLTALARVLIRMEPLTNPKQEAFQQAESLIARSSALNPNSSQTELALMILRVRQANFDAASQAARRALATNPADRTVRSYAGAALFANGRLDEGAALMRSAESLHYSLLPEVQMYLAAYSYLRSDFRAALRHTDMLTSTPCFCWNAIRVASFEALGDSESAQKELAIMLAASPDVGSTYTQKMTERGFAPEIRDKLRIALLKAGLAVQ
ncbi:MAG: hypothetical protein JNK47_04535 [Mesorhizobium sp.]|nr:hypothetical protein [Mesorhizobium sp.]MBL8576470.1 hypothetical protein [Mesorhizobium sp.]